MSKFMFTRDNPFVGTAKAFADNKVYLNGTVLDVVSVGALGRHGLIESAGDGPKPARGRTPKLYRAYSNANMQFMRFDADDSVVVQSNDPADQSGNADAVDTAQQV
jgi:hypothetical protein